MKRITSPRFVVSSIACLLVYSAGIQPALGAVKKSAKVPAAAEAVELICPTGANTKAEDAKKRAKLQKMLQTIASGGKIDAVDKNGQTALMYAAALNERLAVCWLVAKGADVTLKSKKGKSAYDLAHTIAQRELLTVCSHEKEPLTDEEKSDLARFADTPEKMEDSLNKYGRYVEKLSTMLKAGADPTKPCKDGSLLVEYEMPVETIAYLLRQGYNPNTRRADGKMPTRTTTMVYGPRNSISYNYTNMAPESLRLLLTFGMQPDAEDKHSNLCVAIIRNDIKSVQKLLKQDSELIRSKTPAGLPLLTLAVSGDMVRALVTAGADAKENNLLNYFTAASADTVKALLDAGAAIPKADVGKASLLYSVRNPELIPLLVQAGADVNHRGWRDTTPLNEAVNGYELDKVEALLKAGADVDSKNESGYTPLSYTFGTIPTISFNPVGSWIDSSYYPANRSFEESKANILRVLDLLLDAGAAPSDEIWYGVVSKYCTLESEFVTDTMRKGLVLTMMKRNISLPKDILAHIPVSDVYDDPLSTEQRDWLFNTLLDAGADAKAAYKDFRKGEVIALTAAGGCSVGIIKRLIDAGADPKAKDGSDRTALTEAASPEVVELLLSKGANKADLPKTLQKAIEYKNTALIDYLHKMGVKE